MNFYSAQYLKNNVPVGRAYNFRSEDSYTAGDKVTVYGGRKVQIIGASDPAEIERYGEDRIAIITGKVEEE